MPTAREFHCGHPRTRENSRRRGVGYVCKTCDPPRTCDVDGCTSPHLARGMCRVHYSRAVHRGEIPSKRYSGTCTVEGCERPVRARQMCVTHYNASRRHAGRVLQDNRDQTCAEEGCNNQARTRGWCADHYAFWRAVERHGISRERYLEMVRAQGGRCAVCGTDSPGMNYGRWSIDHDHTCCPGEESCGSCIRGLLCRNCNVGLGHFDDDPDRLLAAAAYLLSRTDVLKGWGSVRAVRSVG